MCIRDRVIQVCVVIFKLPCLLIVVTVVHISQIITCPSICCYFPANLSAYWYKITEKWVLKRFPLTKSGSADLRKTVRNQDREIMLSRPRDSSR